MRVLVTGATGFLGSHVAERLQAEGHALRLLLRRTSSLTFLEGVSYERALGDVRDPESLVAAMQGVDAVVHAAGLTTALSEREYRRVNEEGTAAAVGAALRAGVRRFVYVSSLAAQGPSPDGVTREPQQVEPRPTSPYGRSKLGGERHLLRAAGELSAVIVRPPVIYGPRDRGLLPFYRLARLGVVPVYGSGEHRLTWVHVSDAASAVARATTTEVPSGRVYTLSDGRSYSWNELIDLLAGALGRRPLRLPVPHALYACAGLAAGLAARAIRRPLPLDRHKVREFAQPFWLCGHATISEELGWAPAYDARTGIAGTLAWYREHGWL